MTDVLRAPRCPKCSSSATKIYSTVTDGRHRVQYRRCLWCEHRFKTIAEIPEPGPEGLDNGRGRGMLTGDHGQQAEPTPDPEETSR